MVSETGSTVTMSLSLGHFDHEIKERITHFGKPVRHATRDHDHIAFLELPLGAAGDFVAADFAFTRRFAALGFATGHDRRGAVYYVEDVRVALMPLDLPGRRHAPPRLNLVAAVDQHRDAFGKRIVHLGTVQHNDMGGWRLGREDGARGCEAKDEGGNK